MLVLDHFSKLSKVSKLSNATSNLCKKTNQTNLRNSWILTLCFSSTQRPDITFWALENLIQLRALKLRFKDQAGTSIGCNISSSKGSFWFTSGWLMAFYFKGNQNFPVAWVIFFLPLIQRCHKLNCLKHIFTILVWTYWRETKSDLIVSDILGALTFKCVFNLPLFDLNWCRLEMERAQARVERPAKFILSVNKLWSQRPQASKNFK